MKLKHVYPAAVGILLASPAFALPVFALPVSAYASAIANPAPMLTGPVANRVTGSSVQAVACAKDADHDACPSDNEPGLRITHPPMTWGKSSAVGFTSG